MKLLLAGTKVVGIRSSDNGGYFGQELLSRTSGTGMS